MSGRETRQVIVVNGSDRWAWGVSLLMGSYVAICAVGSLLTV
jgi:hypothetical protein